MMAFDYQEWVEDKLDRARSSAGSEWTATCPCCGEFGGFYVNCDPEGHGPWVCFKCGRASKHFAWLVVEVEGCSYIDAVKLMFKHAVAFRRRDTAESLLDRIKGLRRAKESDEAAWDEDGAAGLVDFPLPKEFKSVFHKGKWRVPTYLTKRGFARETLREWGVGYVERCTYGKLRMDGRVIIPVECPNGRSFTARDVTDKSMPKYMNPTGADHALLLFGWKHCKLGSDFAVVEGPLDAMKLWQHGIPAVAFGGKALSKAQLAMLFEHPEDTVVTVMLDPDATANAYGVAAQLHLRFKDVYVAHIPPTDEDGNKLDPGASTKKQAHEWYEDAPRFTGERGPALSARIEDAIRKSQSRFKK